MFTLELHFSSRGRSYWKPSVIFTSLRKSSLSLSLCLSVYLSAVFLWPLHDLFISPTLILNPLAASNFPTLPHTRLSPLSCLLASCSHSFSVLLFFFLHHPDPRILIYLILEKKKKNLFFCPYSPTRALLLQPGNRGCAGTHGRIFDLDFSVVFLHFRAIFPDPCFPKVFDAWNKLECFWMSFL